MRNNLFVLLIVLVFLASGCAGYQSWQADHDLHQEYVSHVKERIGAEDGVGSAITPEANPVVIFENLDQGLLHVVVTSTRGREQGAIKFKLKPGEVKVLPRDVPEAPKFQYRETYSVRWSRDGSNRTYGDYFFIRLKPSYDAEQGIAYNGGYQFLPTYY